MSEHYSHFPAFFRAVFLAEQRNPLNVALHEYGTVLSEAFPLWFIAGNHLVTAELILKGFYWRTAN